MLDAVVLIAMAVTAVAFAAGLVVHSGIAYIPALIAAAALYMVMASSYLLIARSTKSAPMTDRLNELEEALEIIDADLQRIDRVEDDVARLDLLNDRCLCACNPGETQNHTNQFDQEQVVCSKAHSGETKVSKHLDHSSQPFFEECHEHTL